jgi:hypothetical protein
VSTSYSLSSILMVGICVTFKKKPHPLERDGALLVKTPNSRS